MKTLALALSLLLTLAPAARAAGAGADPFNFLFLDANARPVALGGAYTALADDANSLLYNPAGLGALRGHEATFMHDQHFLGITQEYAAYASPKGWSVNVNSLDFGETTKTTYANPSGAGFGAVGLTDLAAGAGYGRQFFERLRLGAGFKYIRESIADLTATGYAFDLGVQHDPALLRGLTLGAAIQNLGPSVRFQRASERLPLNMRLGAAYRFEALGQRSAVALDVTKARSETPLVGFGVESVVGGVLPLRLGFTTRNQAGLGITFGLGWLHPRFGVDYAFVPYGELGSSHRMSVTVRWGGERAKDARAEERAQDSVRSRLNPNARFAAADQAVARGDTDAARRELATARRMLAIDDRRIVLYYTKAGELAYDEGDTEEARELFSEGIKAAHRIGTTGPAVSGSYLGLARCLADSRDMGGARLALRRALEADPSERQRAEIDALLKKLPRAPR
ncbi:MAG: PorV/PorQ family protein [Elusimicrobia bacterium]|nr:PorV/PorQ family protein [Elusimicrobiota bacterium]